MEKTLQSFYDMVNSVTDKIEEVDKTMCQIITALGGKITLDSDNDGDSLTVDMYHSDGISYECNIVEITVNTMGDYQTVHITGESVQYGTMMECDLCLLSLSDIATVIKIVSEYKNS